MDEEEEKKINITCTGIGHGRATFGTGRANTLRACCCCCAMWHGRATLSTGRASFLDIRGSNFCGFLEL